MADNCRGRATFFVLSIILIWVLVSAKKKNKEAVRQLILRIKNNEEAQKEAVSAFLTEKVGLEQTAVKKQSKKIINERKFLFRNLISSLLDKNEKALIGLEDDLSRIVKHYHDLDIQAKAVEEVVEEAEETEDVDALKQEIKTLKHEVHITLTTLNNIFAEFSSMFGEEVPETEMSVDQIITAMESFSGKGGAAEVDDAQLDAVEQELDDEPDAFSEDSIMEEVESSIAEMPDEPDVSDQLDEVDAMEDVGVMEDVDVMEEIDVMADIDESVEEMPAVEVEKELSESAEEETLDFSIDSELDDIDSALDELELGHTEEDEPSWDDAFAESGDKKPDEN